MKYPSSTIQAIFHILLLASLLAGAASIQAEDSDYAKCRAQADMLLGLDSQVESLIQFLPIPQEIHAGSWHLINLKLTEKNNPLALQFCTAITCDAEVFPQFFLIDEEGIGRFLVKPNKKVDDILLVPCFEITLAMTPTVTFSGMAINEITFMFPDGDPVPKFEEYEIDSIGRPVQLEIEEDMIGLLTREGTNRQQVEKWAQGLFLDYEGFFGGGLHVLRTPPQLSQNTRWWLAKELRVKADLAARGAGLMAQGDNLSWPVMLDDRTYVRFKPQFNDIPALIKALEDVGLIVVEGPTRFAKNEFVVRPNPESATNPLSVANDLTRWDAVLYAHPEFAQHVENRNSDTCNYSNLDWPPWCDERYDAQWHLENTGQGGAKVDADIDMRAAWDITTGSSDTLIAVIDSSFFLEHPDLEPNLHHGILGLNLPPDVAAQIKGIDLVDNDHSSLLKPNTGASGLPTHGTNSAGVAAAASGHNNANPTGDVTGVCPDCRFLPIRIPKKALSGELRKALWLASENGADVISMSMGFEIVPESIPTDIKEQQRISQIHSSSESSVIVFAMSNEDVDNCEDKPDSASLDSVIGVGGITDLDSRNTDTFDAQGFGDCMDLLAPTRGGKQGIATTSVIKTPGGQIKPNQFNGFGGTSAATPQVAGVAALILDVTRQTAAAGNLTPDPPLSSIQVQMVLQDTADKAEPDFAHYDAQSGFSRPNGSDPSTHAYGRLNAFEALHLVAPAPKGKANRDLIIRDHELDWGNTSREVPESEYTNYMHSVDIKVDHEPWQVTGANSAFEHFQLLNSEKPLPGTPSRIYVRVRNRGQFNVSNAELTLHYGIYSGEHPENLPVEINGTLTIQPSNTQGWATLETKTLPDLPYSGASLAGCPERAVPPCRTDGPDPKDRAHVAMFEVPTNISWNTETHKLAWLAVLDDTKDLLQPNLPTTTLLMATVTGDNNVALLIEPETEEEKKGMKKCLKCSLILLSVLAILLLI